MSPLLPHNLLERPFTTAFTETPSEMVSIAPTVDFAASAVPFLLPAASKGDINLAVSAGGVGGTTANAESAGLAFNCFTL
jgi:hypothetical protein